MMNVYAVDGLIESSIRVVTITARLSGVLLDKFTSAWFAPASRRQRTYSVNATKTRG